MRRPVVANPELGIGLALLCLGGFWFFLHDATDRRGRDQPVWIRWATWW